MNVQKLSISSLVIFGLMVNSNPAQAHVKPRMVGLGLFGVATLITYRLETKKSVEKPEPNYTWSDIPSNFFKGEFAESWRAFDERFIGQKKQAKSIKLTEGDKEIKATSATPATGVCGTTQAFLASVSKATVETGKVLTVPALVAAIYLKLLKFGIKDDGSVTLKIDPTALQGLKLAEVPDAGAAAKAKEEKAKALALGRAILAMAKPTL